MRDLISTIQQFLSELKRRNVYKVAVTYLVVGFFVIEAADLTLTRLGLPGWTVTLVVVLVGLGFPIALVLAWALQVTPEGIRVEGPEPSDRGGSGGAVRRSAKKGSILLFGTSILAAVLLGAWWLVPASPVASSEDTRTTAVEQRSIAVLPFEQLDTAEPGTFTEGLHDDLLTRLSNISGLKVIARTSVLQYRGSDKQTRQIAKELGVKWVLEGGIQEVGNQIQVNAQLIDPRSETHAWAESYRRKLTAENVFSIQTEITSRIAQSLEVQLGPAEIRRVRQRPTRDLEAFRLYVQGRSRLDMRTEEGVAAAMDLFGRAIGRDSTYALAWAGLADALGLSASYGYGLPESNLPTQEEAALQALALDPDLAEAHASMGFFLKNQKNAGPAALRHLKRSVELQPSYAQAHHWLGWLLPPLGRLEEAAQHASLAVELNPRHAAAAMVLAEVHLAEKRPRKALREVRRARQMYPTYPAAPMNEALALHHLGRFEEARRAAQEGLSQAGGYAPRARVLLAIVHAAAGDAGTARQWLGQIREAGDALAFEGLVLAVLGEREAAFSALHREQAWPGWATTALRYWFPEALASLREDPRYGDLLREVNQVWGLNSDGSLPEDTSLLSKTAP